MTPTELTDRSALDSAWVGDVAVLYKHSPACLLSGCAMREVRRFVEEHPEVSVFVIDVLAQRDLSDHVAARAGIRHESPQAIVLRRGSPVWSASHRGVTAAAIAQQIDSAS